MGYRSLLKSYIRHLMQVAGDHCIDENDDRESLSRRDIAELSLLAAEVEREDYRRSPPGESMSDESSGRAPATRQAGQGDRTPE